ncbi:hypothetical protein N7537_011392 [Penicillium hordei]|uniref:Uncharacterized protein n=1 Tax=Penicillium hordei TaxID=40994 RepID=A0AAD6DN54_9EURO|nr:uncharacterized protein N7537_011392 [Penicillium hordei]KAJ5588714.1 hypothetical protein N7537_011392 [Penicillium hordei]
MPLVIRCAMDLLRFQWLSYVFGDPLGPILTGPECNNARRISSPITHWLDGGSVSSANLASGRPNRIGEPLWAKPGQVLRIVRMVVTPHHLYVDSSKDSQGIRTKIRKVELSRGAKST